jgi:glucokinase
MKAIAIDLGGTQIRAAIVDAQGRVQNRTATNTRTYEGADVIVDQIATAAKALASAEIAGIGVSAPGPLDTEEGVALGLPSIPGFDNYPLLQKLREKLGPNVYLENDGIAAAIGEWNFGAGQGHHSIVYVTVSTGIGGGVIVNDTVLRGRKGMAGHVGHLCIARNGLRCNCGNTGCWERYAAGPFFAARAKAEAGKDSTSSLHIFAELKPADIFAHALKGDYLAQTLVDEEASLLGTGLVSLMHLYSPEKIIIGGGLSNAFAQLEPGIAAYIKDNAMPAFKDTPIVTAALGDNSGLVGAAAMVFG